MVSIVEKADVVSSSGSGQVLVVNDDGGFFHSGPVKALDDGGEHSQ